MTISSHHPTAPQGMLFLDEIGELGCDEQAMLLRAIEEKKFLPVGADKEASSVFQLVAGTNRELSCAVEEGRFREEALLSKHSAYCENTYCLRTAFHLDLSD